METTTILISKEVRNILKAIGRKDETYDDLLRRLIKDAKNL